MPALKGSAADNFVRSPPAEALAVLVFGSDNGDIRERAAGIVRSVAGSLDDPFTVVRLEDSALASDPGRLADEFRAISLGGGRRVVWVTEADKAFQRAVEPLLQDRPGSSIIVAEAGNLGKTAPLRTLFERSANSFTIACYEDSELDLHRLIASELGAAGVSIEPDAEKYLIGILSSDRMLSRSEIVKLALYGMGGPPLTLADVQAVCGDSAEESSDDVIESVFEGDIEGCDRAFCQLSSAGTSPSAVLSMVSAHIARLQQLRVEIDRGRSPEEAIKLARPPIFFKKAEGMTRQLRLWDTDSLLAAGSSVSAAIQSCRTTAALEEAIASRALLSLARNSRALRASRY
jgi:DNA polymerase-3 subunit delta